MVKVAINGYGRIGRLAHRVILERFSSQIEVAAINAGSSTDIKGWMYLLKYDTVYGAIDRDLKSRAAGKASGDARQISPLRSAMQNFEGRANLKSQNSQIGTFIIEGKEIPVFSQKDPSRLPWKKLNVDVVIESTGALRKKEDLEAHLKAGAKRVVLSSPEKGDGIKTIVFGVNNTSYKGEKIISNASCTTNCIAPVAKVIDEAFGIEKAMMTTIHGYTSDQRLQDGGHKDYRRARAAAQNIIPTSTGATTAASKALPALSGTFGGLAIRVPVATGSLSDFTFVLKRDTTKEEINASFFSASQNDQYKGILGVTEDPIVSSDIIGSSYSAIVDLSLTQVVGGNLAKVIAWYDNEYGYANRLVEEAVMVGGYRI